MPAAGFVRQALHGALAGGSAMCTSCALFQTLVYITSARKYYYHIYRPNSSITCIVTYKHYNLYPMKWVNAPAIFSEMVGSNFFQNIQSDYRSSMTSLENMKMFYKYGRMESSLSWTLLITYQKCKGVIMKLKAIAGNL